MPTPTGKTTRAERLAQSLVREVADDITAMANGYGVGSSLEEVA
ncbi:MULTISPECIES: hypothetical protein [Nocardiopsis]|jgi:hypothetical protein|nr:hypothetical protein [Nocardiopsis sp. CNS-639]